MANEKSTYVIEFDDYIYGEKFKTIKAAQAYADRESDDFDIITIYECKPVAKAQIRSRLEWK